MRKLNSDRRIIFFRAGGGYPSPVVSFQSKIYTKGVDPK